MLKNHKTSGFFIGLRYGIYGILLTILFSPVPLILSIYLDAVQRGVEHWKLSRIPLEVYCLAPVIALIFFAVPYLIGATTLGWITEKTYWSRRWTSVLIAVLTGSTGIFLIAIQQGLTIDEIDWLVVILIELWSILIFRWIGKKLDYAV